MLPEAAAGFFSTCIKRLQRLPKILNKRAFYFWQCTFLKIKVT